MAKSYHSTKRGVEIEIVGGRNNSAIIFITDRDIATQKAFEH